MHWYQIVDQNDQIIPKAPSWAKQLKQMALEKLLANPTQLLYQIKILDEQGQKLLINDCWMVDCKQWLQDLKTQSQNLKAFVDHIKDGAKIEIDSINCKLWSGYCRFAMTINEDQHLANYGFNVLLSFDANDAYMMQGQLIKNYLAYFMKQCDDLLAWNNLNLWDLNGQDYQIRFDCGTIIRSDDCECDWSNHDGDCCDFDNPVLNLVATKTQQVIKGYDDCANSLNCQILGLMKDLIAIKQGTKKIKNNGELN